MKLKVKNIVSGEIITLAINRNIQSAIFQNIHENEQIFMGPGLIDLQVNGYKNIDFNNHELCISKIEKVVVELLKDGVTQFCPTLVTNDPQILEHNLNTLNQAISQIPLVRSCISGIHLEGPFISAKEGFAGAHNKKWICKPDLKLFEKWQQISGDNIKLITLSPEYDESIDFIRYCLSKNVKVAIGHSAASYEQIQKAVSAGATLSTHLGNAISKDIHRHNNVLFDQLAEDNLYASIIADGYHLPENLLKIIFRSKQDKVFLISDSTEFTGMNPGIYETVIGGKVLLSDNRKLSVFYNKEFLAGSASSLYQCVNFLSMKNILPISEAWKAASVVPLKYLHSNYSEIANQDIVLFSLKDKNIRILLSIKQNQYFSHYV